MQIKNIGIFITGGIAAYKVPLLVRSLIKQGYNIRVALTEDAQVFVTPETLAILTKNKVLTDENQFDQPEHVEHVELAHWMDLAVVVPATANTLAKLAHGLADNFVSTTLLAFNGPKIVVPAMNDQMWLNPITQNNITLLKQTNYEIIPPATGLLAEGYAAVGRMPEIEDIATYINFFQSEKLLNNKKVLISAGGTIEPIDPVRYITNRSSGKMGYALANAAAALGADVTLVTTTKRSNLPQIKLIQVQTAKEMNTAMIEHFTDSDITIMAAAVSDFHAKNPSTQKIKKNPDQKNIILELEENQDILATLGQQKNKQLLVGFAAETNNLIQNATKKLTTKNADIIIANQVGKQLGFESNQNSVTLLSNAKEAVELPLQNKDQLALNIWQELITFL